jgi:hypothetical protein
MRPEDRDIALLWDMREAAREIVEFIKGTTYHQFTSQKVSDTLLKDKSWSSARPQEECLIVSKMPIWRFLGVALWVNAMY